MGEKIKNIAEFYLGGKKIDIELNNAYSHGNSYDIHLQSEHVQYYLSNKDYMAFAALLICAKEKLNNIKIVIKPLTIFQIKFSVLLFFRFIIYSF